MADCASITSGDDMSAVNANRAKFGMLCLFKLNARNVKFYLHQLLMF